MGRALYVFPRRGSLVLAAVPAPKVLPLSQRQGLHEEFARSSPGPIVWTLRWGTGALDGGRTARRLFCQVAVQGMGYSGAGVARFLGVTTSSVNRLAVSQELPEVKRYLKVL